MTLEEVIKQLEFDRAMILFDPTTGEEITPEILKALNEDNYRAYVADGVAIEALKEIQQYREIGTVKECKELASIVGRAERNELAKVIDEWLKYRKIGTVEECREAVEKQKPEQPVLKNDNGKLRKSCPVCGCFFSPLSRNCPKCGQAIKKFRCECGQATSHDNGLDSIDKYVEYWHNNETGQSLQDFLCMTDIEYETWLKGGNDVIQDILYCRRNNLDLAQYMKNGGKCRKL